MTIDPVPSTEIFTMLDWIGTILLAVAAATVVAAITATLAAGLAARLLFAGLAGAWTGFVVISANAVNSGPALSFPAVFFAPLIAVGVLVAVSPKARSAIAGIPLPLVIGLNAFRVFGFLFLLLAAAGRLGGPFPYFAGIGDIITGMFAIPAALLAMRGSLNDARIIIWNTFGLLDLVVAVSLGVTSRNGSPLQLIHAGAGSAAISTAPWALIPLVLVPLFIIGHLVVFARMQTRVAQSSVSMRMSVAARNSS
jgi:hypothetical protein